MTESAWAKHNREQLKRIIARENERRARKQALIDERKAMRKEIRITTATSPLQRFVDLFRGEVSRSSDDDVRIFRI